MKLEWQSIVENKELIKNKGIVIQLIRKSRSEMERLMVMDLHNFYKENEKIFMENIHFFSHISTREILMLIREFDGMKKKFLKHLEKEFLTENWNFWEKLTELLLSEYNEKFIHSFLKEIMESHLLENSPEEVKNNFFYFLII